MSASNDQKSIGLTLSGGGFRATLFHLGVVRYLYEQQMLHRVSHVCSVSGGSILSAHMVLNWDRYTGTEDQFNEAAREVVNLTTFDLRGYVIRRWLAGVITILPRVLFRQHVGRTTWLCRAYRKLLGDACLGDLMEKTETGRSRPELHLLSTSMTTGELVSFGQSVMQVSGDPAVPRNGNSALQSEVAIPASQCSLAAAVAASSAFPPLFPPFRVDHQALGISESEMTQAHYLADGGVFDNLGIRKLLWLQQEQNLSFDHVVVSDAQREVEHHYSYEFSLLPSRATRCSDLLMNRISWFENDSVRRLCEEAEATLLECRLPTHIPQGHPRALDDHTQSNICNIRTDLDPFSEDEINALIHQGYVVAHRTHLQPTEECGDSSETEKPSVNGSVWYPISREGKNGFDLSSSHRLKIGLFRLSDPCFWLLLLIVVLPVGAFIGFALWKEKALSNAVNEAQVQKEEARAQKEEAQAQKEKAQAQKLIADDALSTAREWERQHIQKKIRLILVLAELVHATNQDEHRAALQNWEEYKREVLQDPWFEGYLNDPIIAPKLQTLESRILTDQEREDIYQGFTLAIANELKPIIRDMEPVGKQVLDEHRMIWFEQVKKLAKWISEAEKPEDVPQSRRRFWQLYYGALVLVEGGTVKSKMVAFGNLLLEWKKESRKEKPDQAKIDKLKQQIDQAVKPLQDALDRELSRDQPLEK